MLLLSMDGLVVAGSVIMCVWISFVGEHNQFTNTKFTRPNIQISASSCCCPEVCSVP